MICGVKKHCLWWVVIRLLADLDMMMSALEGTEYMQTRKHMSLGSVSPPPLNLYLYECVSLTSEFIGL